MALMMGSVKEKLKPKEHCYGLGAGTRSGKGERRPIEEHLQTLPHSKATGSRQGVTYLGKSDGVEDGELDGEMLGCTETDGAIEGDAEREGA